MSSPSRGRARLIEALNQEARQSSTTAVILHHAIARQLGLKSADHKYADILLRMGPMTAGRLAELTGLTSGAVTGIIDRLEKAGWVRRAKDPDDRRRVVIEPVRNLEAERRIWQLFQPLADGMAKLASSYSDKELALILDFMGRSRALAQEHAAGLRQPPHFNRKPGPPALHSSSRPVRTKTRA